jgi:RNA polymerase sigma factor for flagellar operon FliA
VSLAEHTETELGQTYASHTHGEVVDKDEIILEHVPLVKYHAYRIAGQLPPGVEMGDLISAGVLGLMDAVAKFDPTRGVKFKAYAEIRIRGAMIDSLRQLDWAPQSLRRKGKELRETKDKLQHQLGREAAPQEVCEEMGIELHQLHELTGLLNSLTIGSFRESDGPEAENQIEYYPDSVNNGPHVQYQKQELRTLLAAAIDDLNPKERLVVSLYYFEELTMKEIGVTLDVNESRVSQIHAKAIAQLRATVQGFRPLTKQRKR